MTSPKSHKPQPLQAASNKPLQAPHPNISIYGKVADAFAASTFTFSLSFFFCSLLSPLPEPAALSLPVEYAERGKAYGILFIFSLSCEYIHLEYIRIHVIYRANQAEYAMHILVVAPQECLNIYSTRRALTSSRSSTPTAASGGLACEPSRQG